MNDYFTNRNVLVGALLVLLGMSIVDVVLRAIYLSDEGIYLSDYGESLVTIVLSSLLIALVLKGKDRVFYILCGGWLAYFVLSQIYGLPGMIQTFVSVQMDGMSSFFGNASILIHIASMICIIAVGALIAEYMTDGTIYNKAFTVLCGIIVLLVLVYTAIGVYGIIDVSELYFRVSIILATLNQLLRIAMVFLFINFVYDSAKTQLSKTQL